VSEQTDEQTESTGRDPERLQDLEKKADDLRDRLTDIDPTISEQEARPPEVEEDDDGSSGVA
jgi:hypothetical protein